jgi:hypothetical protein
MLIELVTFSPILPSRHRVVAAAAAAAARSADLRASRADERAATQARRDVGKRYSTVVPSVPAAASSLGGHSLLASSPTSRFPSEAPAARRVLRRAHDRASRLAARRRRRCDVTHELQSRRFRRPLFFLHGDLHGGGMYCAKLARALDSDQPLFVFEPQGTGATPLVRTIEAMAQQYVAHVRRIAKHGPYRLGGFCSGGLVASKWRHNSPRTARRSAFSSSSIQPLVTQRSHRSRRRSG